MVGYWTCYVERGHYGHASRKPTWLLACTHLKPRELNWANGEQRLPAWMIERYGYEKARRIGVVAMVGGKNKTAIRNATPEPFRDVLLLIARMAHNVAGNRLARKGQSKLTGVLGGPTRSDKD